MLVILNGAPKSGSTWLVQIVRAMDFCERIPDEFQDVAWANSSIAKDKLDLFLDHFNLKHNNFYCKQHWYGSSRFKQLMECSDVKMVNIIRDIRDVLTSRYFHDLRLGKTEEKDIEKYFDVRGKALMKQYMNYHIFWHEDELKVNQPFLCSYERLHMDFKSQLTELAQYLGKTCTDDSMEHIHDETSLSNKAITRQVGEGRFFRKGIVGDWHNYLSDRVVDELNSLAIETGYLKTKQKMVKVFNLDILEQIDFGVA